jgi:hypothetical protein
MRAATAKHSEIKTMALFLNFIFEFFNSLLRKKMGKMVARPKCNHEKKNV